MKGMEIKQSILKIENRLSILKPLSRKKKNPHHPIPILVLNVLVYIFEVKQVCKKKKFE